MFLRLFLCSVLALTVPGSFAAQAGTVADPDRTAPTIVITRPAAQYTTYPALAQATGTADDSQSGVTRVIGILYRYSNGATPAGYWAGGTTWTTTLISANNQTCSGTTQWSLDLPVLPAGDYSFRAKAIDGAGNMAQSATIRFAIARAVMTINVAPPLRNNVRLAALPSIAGTAAVNIGEVARVTCWLYRYGNATTPAGYWTDDGNWTASYSAANEHLCSGTTSWSLAAPALADGNYACRITATDGVGTPTSTPVIHFTIDSGPPIVQVASPAGVYKTISAATGTASDEGVGVSNINGCLYRAAGDSTPAGYWAGGDNWTASYSLANERLCTGTANWSLVLPTLADGAYWLRATAIDKVGYRASQTSNFIIDRVAPTVTVTQPATEGAKLTVQPVLGGTAADGGTAPAGVQRVTCWFYRYVNGSTPAGYWAGGNSWTTTYSVANDLPCTGTATWSFTPPALPEGNYAFRVTATDAAGNQTVAPIRHFYVDDKRPVLSVAAPLPGNYKSNPTASGTASDGTGIGLARVTGMVYRAPFGGAAAQYWVGGTTWSSSYSDANERVCTGITSWSLKLPKFPEGAYTFRATATDLLGNQSTASSDFIVDATAPSVTSVEVQPGEVENTLVLTGTAIDNGSPPCGLQSVTCWLFRSAEGDIPAGYWAGGDSWTDTYSTANELLCTGTTDWTLVLPSPLPPHCFIHVAVTDRAGNMGVATLRPCLPDGIQITNPRREVPEAPQTATLEIIDDGCTFFIPYIETNSSLQFTAKLGTLIPATYGVEFVLNEAQASEQRQQAYGPDPGVEFTGLAKGVYTLDAYLVDENGQRVDGDATHDHMESIGIGDILDAFGDSITTGCAPTYGSIPFVNWLNLTGRAVSLDDRNFPQGCPQNTISCVGYTVDLNNRLAAYFNYPVFIMNEALSGARSGTFKAGMEKEGFRNRQHGLHPNKWLIHLGVADASGAVDPEIYRANMQGIIDMLRTEYGAADANIFIARPSYAKPEAPYATRLPAIVQVANEVIAANGVSVGPDFYSFFSTCADQYYRTDDYVHPNYDGYMEMSRLWYEAIIQAGAATTAASSTSALSAAVAHASNSTVSLVFNQPLAATASAASHYAVTINGVPISVTRVAYYDAVRMVELTMPAGRLRAGDRVVVSWSDLRNARGRTLHGTTGQLVAW